MLPGFMDHPEPSISGIQVELLKTAAERFQIFKSATLLEGYAPPQIKQERCSNEWLEPEAAAQRVGGNRHCDRLCRARSDRRLACKIGRRFARRFGPDSTGPAALPRLPDQLGQACRV